MRCNSQHSEFGHALPREIAKTTAKPHLRRFYIQLKPNNTFINLSFFCCCFKRKQRGNREKKRLTWHVVISVTPHTIRWIPSTQTFNSITIRPVCAQFICKKRFFRIYLLELLLLLLLHAALQPPRDITTLYVWYVSVFYSYPLVGFNANHRRPLHTQKTPKKLNILFVPFNVWIASRFGLCNTCCCCAVNLASFMIYLRPSLWSFIVNIRTHSTNFIRSQPDIANTLNKRMTKMKRKPFYFIKRK